MGCSSSSNPSSPAPTPTPTVAIDWAYAEIEGGNTSSSFALLQVRVNGSPVTDAAVSMSGNFTGAPLAASYNAPVTHSGVVFAGYHFPSFNYEVGKNYILSTTALGKTASVTFTAPGNFTFSSDANAAVTEVSWTDPGNHDFVEIYDPVGNSDTFYINYATSPVDITPATAYPGSTGSVYNIYARTQYFTTSVANASVTLGEVGIWYEYDQDVTVP